MLLCARHAEFAERVGCTVTRAQHPIPSRGDAVTFEGVRGIVQEVSMRPQDGRGVMLLIRILDGPRSGNVTVRGHAEVECG